MDLRGLIRFGALALAVLSCWSAQAQTSLVSTGAVWKYLDDGSDQGTAWRGTSFVDASWASGAGQLGYGDGDETTIVRGTNALGERIITTYFRRTFTSPDPVFFTNMLLRLLRDDGAVVYLNGTEVFRSNMPEGDIGFTTLAAANVGGAAETNFVFAHPSPSLLQEGPNVLAVEVHQDSTTSTDVSFDLELLVNYVPQPPTVAITSPTPGSSISGNVLIQAAASDIDGNVTNVAFFVDGTKVGDDPTAPYTFVATGLPPGTHTLYAEAKDSQNLTTPSAVVGITIVPQPQGTLVGLGSTWRYFAQSNAPVGNWTEASFIDTSWPSGPAEFGYGDGDEATVVSFGGVTGQKWTTSYYRQRFNVADPAVYQQLSMTLVYDDGAAVYLNGREIFRVNLPAGPLAFSTFASGAADYTPVIIDLSPTNLVAGENVIAVEMHQSDLTSSDVSMALQLTGLIPPTVSIVSPTNGQAFTAPVTIDILAQANDPDGTISQVIFTESSSLLGIATNAPFSIAISDFAEGEHTIVATVTDSSGITVNSAPVTISVTDPRPPSLVNAFATTNQVTVTFSKRVVMPSATTAGNYTIAPSVTVQSAAYGSSSNRIVLNTAPLAVGVNYTLTVNNVRDELGNTIAPGSQLPLSVVAFLSQDVGAPQTAGSATSVPGGYNVVGGGTDIGGTADQFHYNFETQKRSGDFDVRVRVAGLNMSDAWAKAGLMARDDLTASSRFAAAMGTPGISGSFFQYRLNAGGPATNSGYAPSTYPNTWLRLQRQANAFTGYASVDGNHWTFLGTMNIAMPSDVYVGMAVTGRSTNNTTTAQFRNFGVVQGGTIGGLVLKKEPLGPSSRKTGLVISEIMYRPRTLPSGQSLEFIELYNSNPFWEDIGDYRISGEVDYKFAKGTRIEGGSFLVIARDPAAVQSHYGISGVLGPWDGAETNSLPGGGGRIRLRSEGDSVLLEVNYEATPPWPTAPDGAGHSLVLARPSYGENDVRAWAASDSIDGSPGRHDPFSSDPLGNIVINEFLANTDDVDGDYIELYNHANQAIDIANAYLTDEASTNKYRIPTGTVIPARGFVHFNQTTMGFALRGSGEKIFFVNPSQTRVIDAVDFGPQENGVAMGRYPNGGDAWYRMATATPSAANSGLRNDPIVINEIMYNPLTGDSDDEYLELYNRGNGPVNVSGWRFISGIDFTVPPNTIIASNGFLVIARNSLQLLSKYPNLTSANTVGNYDGSLANGGERLQLAFPDPEVTTNNGVLVTNFNYVVVNEMTYADNGRWGNWSDGGGSSLELKDPLADNRQPANWADSDETSKGIWTNIEVTGTLGETLGSPINDSLNIFLLGIGECLLDDVEVRNIVGNVPQTNIVKNPGFESGLTSWFPQGSHDHSVLQAEEAYSGNSSLRLRAASRGDNGANRLRSDTLNGTPAGLVTIRAKAKWLRGWPELLLRIHGGSLEVGDKLATQPNLGSPGLVNSRRVSNAGPAIYDVLHTPLIPADGEDVVVTATASDAQTIASVKVLYRPEPSTTYTEAVMVDNGTAGDSIAGDGVYSATIPGQASGVRVGFYIQATDALGGANTFPQDIFPTAPDTRVFPTDASNRECIVRWGEVTLPGAFGTYRLWLNAANTARWATRRPVLNNAVLDGTFVYNSSRVIYNMRPSYAGSPWHRGVMEQGPEGGERVDFDIEYPGDERFMGAQDAVWNNPGNPNDNNPVAPQIGSTTDNSAQAEQSSYVIFKEMGVQYNYRRYVHVWVNGTQRSRVSNRPGNWIFEDSQQPNGDIIEQWFPDDTEGELYKIEDWFEFPVNGDDFTANNDADLIRRTIVTNGVPAFHSGAYRFMWRKRAVSAGESANDYSTFFSLLNAVSPTALNDAPINLDAISHLMDWEQWMRIFAVQHTIGNWDSYGYDRGKNAYMYKPANGRFHQWTWDIDFTMGIGGNGATTDLFGSTDPRIQRMWRTGEILRAYWHAYWDIINGPLNNSFIDPIIDAKAAAFRDHGIQYDNAAVTTIKNFVRDRRAYLAGRLANLTNAPYAVSDTYTTNGNVLTISGTANLLVHHFEVNGIVYRANWPLIAGGNDINSATNWTLAVPLNPGANVLNLQAFDRLGNPIDGTERTLNINYDTTPVSPAGKVVITEVMYNPALAGSGYIELQNISGTHTFDLSGWQVNGIDFTFPGGTLMPPNSYILLVSSAETFGSAFSFPAQMFEFQGGLDNGGETITLIKPGPTAEQDLVVDKVRYDDDAPWPLAADGTGPSLQVMDVNQDNARVSNWSDGSGWRFYRLTGVPGSGATRLLLYLETAGSVNVDSVYLVAGNVPEAGVNLLQNNDFESGVTPWTISGNHSNSAIASDVAFRGTKSLRLVSGGIGGPAGSVYQNVAGVIATNTYTLSFWYLPTTNASGLQFRLSSSFRTDPSGVPNPVINVRPVLGTPGGQNVFVASFPTYPALWLNEVQAINQNGIADNAGDRDPWIELYNSSSSVINLEGYYLANNYLNLQQWAFPSGSTINPGEFKIIWADGETSETTGTALHTGFALTGTTGSVALVRMVTNEIQVVSAQIVDYLNYAGQQPARSYGDYPDGQLFDRQLFFTVTPGQTNVGRTVSVFINEWLADNVQTLQDPVDNQFEDWFELHNAGIETVDLSGYFLTDNTSQPRQFAIPDGTTIPAGGFLLVWADGEPGQNNDGTDLHTNFRLGAGGEEIALFSPDGNLVDGIAFGAQTADISEGRFPDSGPAPFYAMSTPTPRLANFLDTGGENRPPVISPVGDRHVVLGHTLTLPISASDPDAGQILSYSLLQAPAGAGIGSSSGVLTWTPTLAQTPSVNTIEVRVLDNGSPQLSATRTFTVYVSPPPQVTIQVNPGGTGISLAFPAIAGKRYQVWYKNNLTDAIWTALGTPETATGNSLEINDTIGLLPHRFYQIEVLD